MMKTSLSGPRSIPGRRRKAVTKTVSGESQKKTGIQGGGEREKVKAKSRGKEIFSGLKGISGGPVREDFYVRIYHASSPERIAIIRRGLPASEAKRLFSEVPIGQGVAFEALGLSAATVNKKSKQGEALAPDETERVLGFAALVGQLEMMVHESGDADGFDPRAWLARWLVEPLPALGGERPADLMDTMEGQKMVASALAQMQSGAYA